MQSSDDSSLLELEMLPSTADSSIHAANEVAARLRVDIRTGLTWSEAKYRAKIIGHNELVVDEDDPTWKKYVEQFKNPLILLLLGKCNDNSKWTCVYICVCVWFVDATSIFRQRQQEQQQSTRKHDND